MPLETKLNVWKGKRYVWMLAKGPACVSNTNVKFRSLTLERVKAFFGTACIKDIVTTIRKRRLEKDCLLYTSPSPRDISGSRMPSSA